jgi:hypothetical protein
MPTIRYTDGGVPEGISPKMATVSATTVNGIAKILLQVPPAGRFNNVGKLWFCGTPHMDDIVRIDIVLIQNDVEIVVSSFVDTEVPLANQGLRIPLRTGELESRNILNMKLLPGGVWIRVIGVTGDQRSDTLCMNVGWGA